MKNLTHIIESHGHVIHSILVLLSLQTKDCFCEQRKIKTPHSNFEVCVFVRVIFLWFLCVCYYHVIGISRTKIFPTFIAIFHTSKHKTANVCSLCQMFFQKSVEYP